jgi:hypothetical protein
MPRRWLLGVVARRRLRGNGGNGVVRERHHAAGSWFGGGVASLFGPVLDAVRHHRGRQLWLGPVAAMLVAGLALAFRTRSGHAFVVAYAITRPGEALPTALLKLPLSMFAPAALLPFWFALLQVGVVYSLAQTLVGTRQTIIVAAAGHTVATLSAHLWIFIGPPIGVGRGFAHFGDAGPSVAVIALVAYLAVVGRVGWLAIGLIAYHAVEVGVFNGLSQREHLVGTLTGVVAGTITVLLARRHGLRPQEGPPVHAGEASSARSR